MRIVTAIVMLVCYTGGNDSFDWSEEPEGSQAFLVTLPEWAEQIIQPVTRGDAYEEAVKYGREVLEMRIEDEQQDGKPFPLPKLHVPA